MDTKTTPETEREKADVPAESSAESKETKTEEVPVKTEEVPVKEFKKKKKDDRPAREQTQKLQDEIDKLKRELDDTKDRYQRMLAEYANYKRRTEQEKEQLGSFTKAETLKTLLPALDNLERAVEAPSGEDYKTGVDMTIRQLSDLLKSLGLEEIEAKGAAFDPEIHHAVMREDAGNAEPETVTEVFQKGYRLGDRVLRPAMVKVAN